ncbi:MAG: TraB/GumN family protein, partial [Sphingomonas sp.]|nr:TraB/GumN family protein [Sphingomonas sp.]
PAPAQVPAAAPLPDADPAIWVVKDADTTIYLFGTFHALDCKHDWFNDEVKTAFDGSNELVMELANVSDQAAAQQAIARHAVDSSGKPLTQKLSPATRAKYLRALGDIGVPALAFDNFKPFFPALAIVMANAQKLGFTGEQGAEQVLTKAAKDGGKPIAGLETIDFQMGLFANMPEADQIKMLEETLDDLDEIAPMFARMNDYWTRGDAEGFAKLMNEMSVQSPAAHKLLLIDRNATWAEWIDQRLDKPGVVFVAVGAGHLGGKDSVQDMLAKRSIQSSRVPSNSFFEPPKGSGGRSSAKPLHSSLNSGFRLISLDIY